MNIKIITKYEDSYKLSGWEFMTSYERHGGAFNPITAERYKNFVLVQLDEFDKTLISHIKLKETEIICRFFTDNHIIAKTRPLIKLNYEKGLVYFMTAECYDGESNIQFETKGIKTTYMTIVK